MQQLAVALNWLKSRAFWKKIKYTECRKLPSDFKMRIIFILPKEFCISTIAFIQLSIILKCPPWIFSIDPRNATNTCYSTRRLTLFRSPEWTPSGVTPSFLYYFEWKPRLRAAPPQRAGPRASSPWKIFFCWPLCQTLQEVMSTFLAQWQFKTKAF